MSTAWFAEFRPFYMSGSWREEVKSQDPYVILRDRDNKKAQVINFVLLEFETDEAGKPIGKSLNQPIPCFHVNAKRIPDEKLSPRQKSELGKDDVIGFVSTAHGACWPMYESDKIIEV